MQVNKQSKLFLESTFNFEKLNDAVIGRNAYGGPEWAKFFKNGNACYCHDGNIENVVDFNSHQDCADFIMIKE